MKKQEGELKKRIFEKAVHNAEGKPTILLEKVEVTEVFEVLDEVKQELCNGIIKNPTWEGHYLFVDSSPDAMRELAEKLVKWFGEAEK